MARDNLSKFSDHDMLIRLDAKFDELSATVKTQGDGIVARIILLETWKEKVDIYHAKIDLTKFEDNSRWVDNLRANAKLILFFLILVFPLITAILSRVILKFFGF